MWLAGRILFRLSAKTCSSEGLQQQECECCVFTVYRRARSSERSSRVWPSGLDPEHRVTHLFVRSLQQLLDVQVVRHTAAPMNTDTHSLSLLQCFDNLNLSTYYLITLSCFSILLKVNTTKVKVFINSRSPLEPSGKLTQDSPRDYCSSSSFTCCYVGLKHQEEVAQAWIQFTVLKFKPSNQHINQERLGWQCSLRPPPRLSTVTVCDVTMFISAELRMKSPKLKANHWLGELRNYSHWRYSETSKYLCASYPDTQLTGEREAPRESLLEDASLPW